jgi:hypothetical protein
MKNSILKNQKIIFADKNDENSHVADQVVEKQEFFRGNYRNVVE